MTATKREKIANRHSVNHPQATTRDGEVMNGKIAARARPRVSYSSGERRQPSVAGRYAPPSTDEVAAERSRCGNRADSKCFYRATFEPRVARFLRISGWHVNC